MLEIQPIMDPLIECLLGTVYGIGFLAVALFYFKYQMKKLLKEGPKTVGMYLLS